MKKPPRQDVGSLTLRDLVVRIAMGGAVLACFFSLLYLFNQWYLQSRSLPSLHGEQILVPLDNNAIDSASPTGGNTPAPQENADPQLTFFHTLSGNEQAPCVNPPDQPKQGSDVKPAAVPPTAASGTGAASPSASSISENQGTAKPPGAYAVQVASFPSLASAESFQKHLQESGVTSYVFEARLESGATWYRVRVGSRLSRAEAESLAEKVRKQAAVSPMVVNVR